MTLVIAVGQECGQFTFKDQEWSVGTMRSNISPNMCTSFTSTQYSCSIMSKSYEPTRELRNRFERGGAEQHRKLEKFQEFEVPIVIIGNDIILYPSMHIWMLKTVEDAVRDSGIRYKNIDYLQ